MAALVLWPTVEEPTYRLVARCFGEGRAPEWDVVLSSLVGAGLVEPTSAPEPLTFRSQWLPTLRGCLVGLGGADAVRIKLVSAWLVAPDRHLVAEVAGWASNLASWGAVDAIWKALSEHP